MPQRSRKAIILSDFNDHVSRLYALDLHQFLERNNYSSQIIRISDNITSQRIYMQKETLFIALGPIPHALPVDGSSRLIFIPRLSLSADGVNTARKSNVVIAHSIYAAHIIGIDLQSHNVQTPICYLPPYIDLDHYKFNRCHTRASHIACHIEGALPNLEEISYFTTTDNTWMNKAQFYFHIGDVPMLWDRHAYVAMANGIPVIAENRGCYSEFIINGYNGYLIEHFNNIHDIKVNDDYETIAINARAMVSRLCEEATYFSQLEEIAWDQGGQNINFPLKHIRPPEKEWIVRDRHLKDGKLIFWPVQFRKSLNELRSNNIIDILRALSNGQFRDAYIFGVDFGDDDIYTVGRVKLIVKSLGEKARSVHFCMDENNIPTRWRRVLESMSIISLREGLRQTQQN